MLVFASLENSTWVLGKLTCRIIRNHLCDGIVKWY